MKLKPLNEQIEAVGKFIDEVEKDENWNRQEEFMDELEFMKALIEKNAILCEALEFVLDCNTTSECPDCVRMINEALEVIRNDS